jgi:hypothetical protein
LTVALVSALVTDLATQLSGAVPAPEDEGYEEARITLNNGLIDLVEPNLCIARLTREDAR